MMTRFGRHLTFRQGLSRRIPAGNGEYPALGLVKVQSARAVPESHVVGEHASAAVIEALNCLRVAITIYDSNQILIYANQHFDYLFRSLPQRDSLIGMPYDALVRLEVESGEIADEAHGGDVEGFLARRRAQFNEGDFHPLDVPLSDGRIIELKARRTPEGGWIALWTDATQARHATSRLEKAIELSADAFAFFDRNDKLVVCNQEFAAIYGRSLPEMRGTEFRTMIADAVARERILIEGDKDVWLQRRLDLHNSPAGAMTLETKLGKAYLVRDRKTKGGGRVTVLTDVTDERRVEIALGQTRQALAESQGEAQKQASYLADLTRRLDAVRSEADNAKKTLLRTMSHELKTPLNAIIGFSDLLMQMAQGLGPDQIREYAGLIHAGGHNLLRLINQILDLTKIAGGKFELHRTRLDAGGALWLASDAFGERAAARDIRIDASACPIGLLVDVDESAFGQMVHQLLDNALSFTQDGGVIALSAVRKNDRVTLSVADNGPGVASEDLERILQPFEQAVRNASDHKGGAGLGLTLVKAFAELHAGSLYIASQEGCGFTATIELPAAE
jgi:signal transduction histidine kinase